MNLRTKQNNIIFESNKLQQEQVVNSVLKTKSNTIKTLVFDYTYWDEVVDYVNKKKSKDWGKNILSPLLPSYKMSGLWVFDLKNNELYQLNNINDSSKIKLELSKENWENLYKNHFVKFFQQTKNGFIEIHGATIHPSSDIQRKTIPHGYFFVGQFYDKNYFEDLKDLTNCEISIINPDSTIIPPSNIQINITKPLIDINNRIIAKLVFSRDYEMLQNFRSLSVFYMFFIISAVIITLLVFYVCFHLWVNKPLKAIMNTLSCNSTEPIKPLLKKKNEFGKIAELITNFIEQKEILQKEINKRQEVEIAFSIKEQLYKSLFNSTLVGICFSKGQQIINSNSTFLEIFGYDTIADLKNTKIIDLVTEESKQVLYSRYSKRNENQLIEQSYELKVLCNKGTKKDILVYSQDINIDNEIYQQAIFNDITDKKKAEKDLLLEKVYFQKLFDESPEAIAITDNHSNILKINKQFAILFGYSFEEAIGKKTIELLQPDNKVNDINNLVSRVLKGESINYESKRKNKKGENIDVHILGSPIIFDNSQLGIYAIYRDITEKKKHNDELKQRSKLFKSIANGLSNFWKLEDEQKSINVFLETLGKATNADRTYIFKNNIIDNEITTSQIYEWVEENTNSEFKNPLMQNIHYHPDFTKWYNLLIKGKILTSKVNNLPEPEQLLLKPQLIKTIMLVPVFVNNTFWGFIGLDNCKEEKDWSDTEISIMSIAANNIGNFMERKIIEEDLKKAKYKAEESDRIKSNFIANMSHELRTPLNGMLGFAELLNDELENDEHKEMLSVIQKSGNRLMDTLNSILDLSLIEANRIIVEKNNIRINDVFTEKNEYYHEIAKQRQLSFSYISKCNYHIYTDIKLLNRILNNLLDNAFKYTKKGGITIELTDEIIQNNNFLIIKIIDTGIGIDQKHFKDIFEYFRQLSEGLSREYEGNGIGLTICKKYVVLLSGFIEVESKINEGSTFTIKLPGLFLEDNKNPTTAVTKTILFKPKILLVEDEVSNREYTYYVLSKEFEVDVAENATIAINLTKTNTYSAILMDINLGKGLNGIEATKEIRKNPEYDQTPVAAVTANAMLGQQEEYLANGMTHYISKPYNKNKIINLVKNMIYNEEII